MSTSIRCPDCPVAGQCIVDRTRHRRYCDWAASGDPAKIQRIRELSEEAPPAPAPYPSIVSQIGTAARAVGRVASAIVQGEPVLATAEETARRLVICGACPEFVVADGRCLKCGCSVNLKARLATEEGQCPLGKW